MLFATNPHITGAAISQVSDSSESMDLSSGMLEMGDLDISSLSSHMSLGAEEMIGGILGAINKSENDIYDSAAIAMENPLNPAASVMLQKSVVKYSLDLTLASKVAKCAGDFVKETTKIS
jgi:hypothetical protein